MTAPYSAVLHDASMPPRREDRERMGYTPEQMARIEARDAEFAREEAARGDAFGHALSRAVGESRSAGERRGPAEIAMDELCRLERLEAEGIAVFDEHFEREESDRLAALALDPEAAAAA